MLGNQFDRLTELRALQDDTLRNLNEIIRFSRTFQDVSKDRPFQSKKVSGCDFSLLESTLFSRQGIITLKALRIDKDSPIPSAFIENAISGLRGTSETVNELLTTVRNIGADARDLSASSGSHLLDQQTGAVVWDIAGLSQRIVSHTDQMMFAVATIASLVGASQVAENDSPTEIVRDEVGEVVAALAQVDMATQQAQTLLNQVQAANGRVDQLRAAMEALLSEARTSTDEKIESLNATVASVAESATKASNDSAVVAARREEIDRLTAIAEAAHKDISGFKANLDATRTGLGEAHDRARSLAVEFDDQRAKVAEMILQAERMVSGSTVAGLAKAFDEERKALDKSMNGAFWWFIIGICSLFLTSGALAAYILGIPIQGLEWLTKRGTADPTLAQVLSRAIIIIAPFWLTLFSARRYRSLFDLRQQYSHKYNMAFSMDGFKVQAPKFAESIAAWVFTIVAANPSLPKAGRAMDNAPPMSVQGLMNEVKELHDGVMGKEAR
jgi:hypothetical protein